MEAVTGSASCNCMYGGQDPRCCINRARQKALDDAYQAGRRGDPWPPPQKPIGLDHWQTSTKLDGMDAPWLTNITTEPLDKPRPPLDNPKTELGRDINDFPWWDDK